MTSWYDELTNNFITVASKVGFSEDKINEVLKETEDRPDLLDNYTDQIDAYLQLIEREEIGGIEYEY